MQMYDRHQMRCESHIFRVASTVYASVMYFWIWLAYNIEYSEIWLHTTEQGFL